MMQSHQVISIALERQGYGNSDILELLFILVVGLGVIILVIIGQRRKGDVRGTSMPDAGASTQKVYQQNEPASYVKRCPTCKSIFTDETLAFCLSDGSTLERVPDTFTSNDPNATPVYPQADRGNIPPTVQYRPDMFPNKKG